MSSAYADQTVLDAAKLMNDDASDCLVVTRGETVVGIFSERDITHARRRGSEGSRQGPPWAK